MNKCKLCGTETDSLVHEIEQTVLRMIKNANPEWTEKDGSCPKCVDYYANLDDAVQFHDPDN